VEVEDGPVHAHEHRLIADRRGGADDAQAFAAAEEERGKDAGT
jgi:hypothetical protein